MYYIQLFRYHSGTSDICNIWATVGNVNNDDDDDEFK